MLIAILNTTEFAQMKDSFDFYKSSHQKCSIKKNLFLKISQYSKEITCVGDSF